MAKLTDLNPRWVGAGGDGIRSTDGSPAPERHGVGVSFDCPCAACTAKRTGDEGNDFYLRVFVGLSNPLDGGPPHDPRPGAQWQRTGDTFDALTLTPSIQRHKVGMGGCDWHGFVTNGETRDA
jgi:uncharacterized protein DUF6527